MRNTPEKVTATTSGRYTGCTTATNGHNETYNWNGEHSANVNAAAVQKVFNETVIWNVMTAKPVTLQSMGGTIIQLADSTYGFDNPDFPKALIFTGEGPSPKFRNAIRDSS